MSDMGERHMERTGRRNGRSPVKARHVLVVRFPQYEHPELGVPRIVWTWSPKVQAELAVSAFMSAVMTTAIETFAQYVLAQPELLAKDFEVDQDWELEEAQPVGEDEPMVLALLEKHGHREGKRSTYELKA